MTTQLLPDALPTPATVVLEDRLQRNLVTMACAADSAGVELRPHAKTHKCVQIARRQLALGARGLSVATIGEAERVALPAEADDVFIAYPLWADGDAIGRLRALSDRLTVTVGADSPTAVRRLAPLAGRVQVMAEVDCGLGRSGTAPGEAGRVAQAAEAAGLSVAGTFTFPGHSYAPGAGARAAADEAAALAAAADALTAAGFTGLQRSGGSTPSARFTDTGTVTELRPGVYVFNDAQQLELGSATADEVALVVAATVVSRPRPGVAVLDAGSKVLGPDRPAWLDSFGRVAGWPEAGVNGLWEHHAVVDFGGSAPQLGSTVAVIPNHVCTAVNLVPELLVVDAGQVVDRWPVTGRDANR